MGCIESTEDGHKRRITLSSLIRGLQQKNKVVPFTNNTTGIGLDNGRPMLNLTRKTEQLVMEQLWAEGIIPKRREGGVEFMIEIGDNKPKRCAQNPSASILPGVPQSSPVAKPRPALLQPISKIERMIAIEEKMDRAKLNRSKKIQERKQKAAKASAKAQRLGKLHG